MPTSGSLDAGAVRRMPVPVRSATRILVESWAQWMPLVSMRTSFREMKSCGLSRVGWVLSLGLSCVLSVPIGYTTV